MNCNCNNNYYVDENGQRHTDIPMGTSPQAAYARTNLLLKDKVDQLENEMADVQEALTQTEDNVSTQLETALNTMTENLEETSDNIQASVTSALSGINARVDNIIAHNNDTEGNTELVDIRTGADNIVYNSAGQAVRGQIADIYSEMDSKSPIWFDENKGNLYNYRDDTYGYYINYQNGEIISQPGYYVTDYIEVLPRKTIYKNYAGYGAFYDEEKHFISGHDYAVQSCTVPPHAGYYRTAFPTAQRTTAYVSYRNEYTPYTRESSFDVTNESLIDWLDNHYQAKNEYNGKKIAVIGDSWSDTANNTCNKRWHDWIAQKTGASIQCVAVSGTGYKRGTGSEYTTSNFMQQALTIDSDTDLVIIFGSGNDCGTSETANYDFGTAKDTTNSTLGGCMNITLNNIQSTAPNARILMVSPAPWINYDPWWEGVTTGRMGVYTELIKNVAAYRGVRFKDMYHSSDMHPQNPDFKADFYNSDGIHPNDAGQKRLYPDILAEVKAILPVEN